MQANRDDEANGAAEEERLYTLAQLRGAWGAGMAKGASEGRQRPEPDPLGDLESSLTMLHRLIQFLREGEAAPGVRKTPTRARPAPAQAPPPATPVARPTETNGHGDEFLPREPEVVAGVLPYAQVPHDLIADHRLDSTTRLVGAALLYWAHQASSCYPCNETIGKRLGISGGSAKRCLLQLERHGWIRREEDRSVMSGRRIFLVWRERGR